MGGLAASEGRTRAVAIGGSAGAMAALLPILDRLPGTFRPPVIVVTHLHKTDGGRFAEHLARRARLPVVEATDKLALAPRRVHVAPADYHLLVERAGTLALSIDPRVNWSRPSIDVLLESAARAFGPGLVAVILSGANADGARGLGRVRQLGGRCVVQDPATASAPEMPRAAIASAGVEEVLAPDAIGAALAALDPGAAEKREEVAG